MSLTGSPDHTMFTTRTQLFTCMAALLAVKCFLLIRRVTPESMKLFLPDQKDGPCVPLILELAVPVGLKHPTFLQKADVSVLGCQKAQHAKASDLILHTCDIQNEQRQSLPISVWVQNIAGN